jgi:hypothetical protein
VRVSMRMLNGSKQKRKIFFYFCDRWRGDASVRESVKAQYLGTAITTSTQWASAQLAAHIPGQKRSSHLCKSPHRRHYSARSASEMF